jgi:hypothetical protein
MQKTSGEETFPIWLLGDSNPENWATKLDTPLDPRHPARHSIWTPVLDEIQDAVFRTAKRRINTRRLYVRNAVENSADRPKRNLRNWSDVTNQEVKDFQELLGTYHPPILFTFGSFACEFARRALNEAAQSSEHWTTERLGKLFRTKLHSFTPTATNLIPLLHTSIARRYFLQSHKLFCGEHGTNYFYVVGQEIASTLLEKAADLPLWIE